MLENGFIVLHRKMVNWEWYTDTNTKVLFLHLILTANYEPKKWHGITIERGQRVASLSTLAKETGLTVKCIRTALNHLKQTNEVASQSTSRYTLFTVINYDFYQHKGQTKRQTADKLRANKGQTRSNNETKINNNNKDNKENKGREGLNSPALPTQNFSFGAYQNVKLTKSQHKQLIDKFGEAITEDYINKVDLYCEMNGKEYKNYYVTICRWIDEDCPALPEPEKKSGDIEWQ